jgi:hypothetical protein
MCFVLNVCALRSSDGAGRSDRSTPLTPLYSVGHRSCRILKISDLLTILRSLRPLRRGAESAGLWAFGLGLILAPYEHALLS